MSKKVNIVSISNTSMLLIGHVKAFILRSFLSFQLRYADEELKVFTLQSSWNSAYFLREAR